MYLNTPSPAGLLTKPIESRSNNPLPSIYALINHFSHYQTCITLICSQSSLIPQPQLYSRFFASQVMQNPKPVVRGGTELHSTIAFNFRCKINSISLTPPQPELQIHCTSNGDMQAEICKELNLFLTWNSLCDKYC